MMVLQLKKNTMKKHNSMRGECSYALYNQMKKDKDKDVWLLCFDLGYGVFDQHFKDFPERVLNLGASEAAGMDIAVGLAYEGKKVFTYTITPFYYRAFETIRTYIDHEKLPICLLGSGRDDDYKHDGYSHNAEDIHDILKPLKNIQQYYPDKENISYLIEQQVKDPIPCFISLRR